ncbi:kynureninase [Dichomitus squalens LYAD-421 SS1]|uniref:kynureninase n=1 Tax=Dichomitus squalens (strain LYAD-421) TaxID=732165 RepID=UPI000441193C|nr:kynureninase [Dichomitus squalens LYAD-421 SS1]EJF65981.1 kynureninase [Dichomitus squalens LYAD-421 SS1]
MGSPADQFKLAPSDDPLSAFRDEFVIPTFRQMNATAVSAELADQPCTYLCGNSLGLLPKRAKKLVQEELEVWGTRAVEGHFDHPHGRSWMYIADTVHPYFADLVGASESEVACMGTLTANLHLMLNAFYKPTQDRYKILCEAKAFPSDQYAFATQVASRGLDPSDAIIELSPRPGEHTLRTADILSAIARAGPSIALVLLPGVQFYTGQYFAIADITAAARAQGCVCGWDLAHAVGNVPLALHAWGVDFAVWCTYKYLNGGPGAIGGLFVHARHADLPVAQAGWWGHEPATRFDMPPRFQAIRGAQGFQQSNPSVLATAALLGAVRVFRDAGGMERLRARSERLTGYLEALLKASRFYAEPVQAFEKEKEELRVSIITPSNPAERGAQLSLVFLPTGRGIMPRVLKGLEARGVVGDSRKPDVIRLAPAPLYNTFEDVEQAVGVLDEVLGEVEQEGVPPAPAETDPVEEERLDKADDRP